MFYSHQLLARKAPLGQIWMAATMHAKMNRKKLDQIDIIRICEEILNPSVPMALRLSGILMGGVVIVYERKVRLLYDDVNRFLLEVNSAWKVKPAVDPTVLPKGKNQAKFNAVTLPEKQNVDEGDVEQTLDLSNKGFSSSMGFQLSGFCQIRLDTIDELSESFRRNEQNEHHHQANPADITIEDRFDSCQNRTGPYNPFERFDIEGDEETQFNAFSQEHTIPPSNMHSPPHNMEPQPAVDVFNQQPEKQGSESTPRSGESEQKDQPGSRKRIPARNRARRQAPFLMDVEQTMIPSNLYQSWLQNSTDIRSSRPKITERDNTTSARKISKLMDLPPVAVCCGLVGKNNDVHYPKPLLVQWLESMQQPHDSPSGRTTSPRPPEPSSSSPPSGQGYQDPPLREVLRDGITSERLSPRENIMDNQPIGTEVPNPILNAMFPSEGRTNPMVSAHDSGASLRSLSLGSPSSGHQVFSNTSDNSGRNNKKRPSTRLTGTGLESVDEGSQWIHDAGELNLAQTELGFKKPRRPQYGLTPEHELLVQTGPTQTLRPLIDEETEKMTKNVATHLKQYFETPGAPQIESLNQLAYGMNRKQAAQLFYQTCVLVTRDVLRVEQKLAYGDIIVSRGAKM